MNLDRIRLIRIEIRFGKVQQGTVIPGQMLIYDLK